MAFVIRAAVLTALLVTFVNASNPFVLLASALCFGGVAGYEVSEEQYVAFPVAGMYMIFNGWYIGLAGKAMTGYFFQSVAMTPWNGFLVFMALVVIAAFLVQQVLYTQKHIDSLQMKTE